MSRFLDDLRRSLDAATPGPWMDSQGHLVMDQGGPATPADMPADRALICLLVNNAGSLANLIEACWAVSDADPFPPSVGSGLAIDRMYEALAALNGTEEGSRE